MAIEQGIVIRMGAHGAATAWVKTARSSACESCASKDQCNPGQNSLEQEVEVINSAGARVGDRIQLAIHTRAMLKAIFLLYLFPILCMLVGGIAGDSMAPLWNANPSTVSVIMALGFLGIALILVRFTGQRMGGMEEYRPKIIRILSREPHNAAEENASRTCARLDSDKDRSQRW